MHRRAPSPAPPVPALRPGAHIRVVAPSGPVPSAPLAAGLAVLERLFGARVSLDATAEPDAASNDRYLAAPDAARAAALAGALADPGVDAVWCARGGYGAGRLLPLVADAVRGARKALVGFSDVTALHCAAAGAVTFHGPVVTQLGRVDDASLDATRALLTGATGPDDDLLRAPVVLRPGAAEGPLAGGNLALLASLCGTPWGPDLRGAIVVLEDVGEPAYRIDRMIWQLRHAAGLDDAAAVVLGTFDGVEAPEPAWTEALWAELASALRCPVVAGAPVGHGAANHPLPLGAHARLDGPALTLLSPAVRP